MRCVINGVSITDDGILLGRKREHWILPGGQLEEDETHAVCLTRELSEEFPALTIVGRTTYYGQIIGTTPHQGDQLIAHLYFMEIKGSIEPSREILESCRTAEPLSLNLSDITRKAILALQQSGHLK